MSRPSDTETHGHETAPRCGGPGARSTLRVPATRVLGGQFEPICTSCRFEGLPRVVIRPTQRQNEQTVLRLGRASRIPPNFCPSVARVANVRIYCAHTDCADIQALWVRQCAVFYDRKQGCAWSRPLWRLQAPHSRVVLPHRPSGVARGPSRSRACWSEGSSSRSGE